jgi:hypothetical protein
LSSSELNQPSDGFLPDARARVRCVCLASAAAVRCTDWPAGGTSRRPAFLGARTLYTCNADSGTAPGALDARYTIHAAFLVRALAVRESILMCERCLGLDGACELYGPLVPRAAKLSSSQHAFGDI